MDALYAVTDKMKHWREVQVAKEVEVDAVAGKEECVVVVAEMVAVATGQC